MKTCKRCGSIEFYSDGRCKSCRRKYNRDRSKLPQEQARRKKNRAAWAKKNAAQVKKYLANWYRQNKSKAVVYREKRKSKYYEADKAYFRSYYAAHKHKWPEWKKNNPERARENSIRGGSTRRARKRGNASKLSVGINAKLFFLQRGSCACCRKSLGEKYHLDHIMPLALGGEHADRNMQLLCKPCNLSKHAKHPIDFMQSRGFLL